MMMNFRELVDAADQERDWLPGDVEAREVEGRGWCSLCEDWSDHDLGSHFPGASLVRIQAGKEFELEVRWPGEGRVVWMADMLEDRGDWTAAIGDGCRILGLQFFSRETARVASEYARRFL
jgi:hypothetical protein